MTYYPQNYQAMDRTLEDNSFIARTYRLLVLSLMTGAAGAWYGLNTGVAKAHPWYTVGAYAALLFFAFCVQKVRGMNLIALFGAALAGGFALSIPLGWMMAKGYGEVILPSFLLTAALFTVISIYVHLKATDFSRFGGFLFTALCIAAAGWVFVTVYPFAVPMQVLWISGLGLLAFTGYIFCDTSILIHHLGPDDAVQGALSLHLDIYALFFNLLRGLADALGSANDGWGWAFDSFDFLDLGDFF